jgi:hypothetical protein
MVASGLRPPFAQTPLESILSGSMGFQVLAPIPVRSRRSRASTRGFQEMSRNLQKPLAIVNCWCNVSFSNQPQGQGS